MSDVAIGGPAQSGSGGAFSTRTVAVLILVGVITFVAMLVLGAYAPDLRSGRNGGAHALSNAATGYSGIVRLAEATGRGPQIVRDVRKLDTEDLVVLTPETGATDMTKVLEQRLVKPTLVILPKWQTIGDRSHSGWVRFVDFKPTSEADGVLAPKNRLTTTRYPSGGRPLQALPWMPATIPLSGAQARPDDRRRGAQAADHR